MSFVPNSEASLYRCFIIVGNAGVFLAEYLDANKHLIQGKRVLELGAGAGLPSMISALNGAKRVITTDYPDKPLIDRLRHNIDQNLTGEYSNRVDVQGYLWGSDPAPLLKSICSTEEDIEDSEDKFDVIIMCDLIFNHSQHQNMLKTCLDCLAPGGIIYAAFTHHRPWLADKDMAMFPLASQMGFEYQLEMMHKEQHILPRPR